MVRPVRLIALLAVVLAAVVALAAPGSASARLTPAGERLHVVVVDRISDATSSELAHRGAVGLLRPGYGPTTNRRRALAELVRGTEVNARLGGVPAGKPLINTNKASVYPDCRLCIVVQLPPRGRPTSNDRLYRIAVIGNGFHGLLTSPTTHIPGLVSVVDIAPTDLPGHPTTTLSWTPTRNADASWLGSPSSTRRSERTTGSSSPPSSSSPDCCSSSRCSACGRALTAVPAALLVNLALGMSQVSNEVLLVCRALGRNGAPGVRARALLPQRLGAPRALRRRRRAVRLRDGHAAGVAGGEPVRADAELAVLGDRQPDRDAAARAAPRRGVPRAAALRDRGLRAVRRLRARGDDGQPARLRRRWCDRARRRAGGARVRACSSWE